MACGANGAGWAVLVGGSADGYEAGSCGNGVSDVYDGDDGDDVGGGGASDV